MKKRFGSIVAWICVVLVAAFNTFAAIMKFIPQPMGSPGELMMQQLGISTGMEHVLGVIELAIVALYVIPRTTTVGFIFLIGYLGGALATNLTHGFTNAQAAPIYVLFLLMVIAAWFRSPELLTRAQGKKM